jgi:hypothetical protein
LGHEPHAGHGRVSHDRLLPAWQHGLLRPHFETSHKNRKTAHSTLSYQTMPALDNLHHAARCDLLCYLVIGQLVEHARSRAWLCPARLAESMRYWLSTNRLSATRAGQRQLARRSVALASGLQRQPPLRDPAILAGLAFDGWRLNFRPPLLGALRAACEEYLTHAAPATRATPKPRGRPAPAECAANNAYTACLEARALSVTVSALRKAQGKKNPQDLPMRPCEWQAINEDFARDVLLATRNMLGNPAGDDRL